MPSRPGKKLQAEQVPRNESGGNRYSFNLGMPIHHLTSENARLFSPMHWAFFNSVGLTREPLPILIV
jgi:hypothetical protein